MYPVSSSKDCFGYIRLQNITLRHPCHITPQVPWCLREAHLDWHKNHCSCHCTLLHVAPSSFSYPRLQGWSYPVAKKYRNIWRWPEGILAVSRRWTWGPRPAAVTLENEHRTCSTSVQFYSQLSMLISVQFSPVSLNRNSASSVSCCLFCHQ